MIHLCVVWRNGKKTITSSDTVTPTENLAPTQKEISNMHWTDSEIVEYLNEGMREAVK